MRAFVVGGAVRDALLGLPVQDHDWVVVGATPQELLAQGFRPVGKDFPVFLHPGTGEEYALARTERKSGRGYKGFAFRAAPDITLEEDLLRRDLTINAMARDEQGNLIDPYGGRHDLAARIFRHVSPAFAEDPVRILRVARFAARFPDFSVAPETLALMRAMVHDGEVDHLVPERVWQELSRGLMEATPSRMLCVLHECGALLRIVPEIERVFAAPESPRGLGEAGRRTLAALDRAAASGAPLPVRWACLLGGGAPEREPAGLGPSDAALHAADEARTLSERLKAPNDCRDLAHLFVREAALVERAAGLPADAIIDLLERTDAFRRPERFEWLLDAATCASGGQADRAGAAASVTRLRSALAAARAVDAGAVARACADKARIGDHVREARIAAVESQAAATAKL